MLKNIIKLALDVLEEHTILRYIISGGTSASVNISLFSLFFYVFHVHYIVSNIIAFCVAFFVSLWLQKFWTFRDHSKDGMHVQGLYYLLNSLLGLVINTSFLYICVRYFSIKPIFGVIIAGMCTALITFQISSRFIFNKNTGLGVTKSK